MTNGNLATSSHTSIDWILSKISSNFDDPWNIWKDYLYVCDLTIKSNQNVFGTIKVILKILLI